MTVTLDIQQPQPFDLVGSTIMIAGNAAAFEGTLSIRVSEGHDEYSSFTNVGSLGLRQFQASIDIPDTNSFQLNRLFLTLADDTGNELMEWHEEEDGVLVFYVRKVEEED